MPGIDLAAFTQVNHVRLGLHEIVDAAADYPLVFLKDADTGQFRLTALFGLKPGTNAFLDGDFWQAVYLPQEIAAAPFRIGGSGKALCIDEASVLVTTDAGDALFDEDGAETATLLQIRAMLEQLERGRDDADRLVVTLLALGLIGQVSMTVHLQSGEQEAVQGLYSVSPPKLRTIAPDALLDLRAHDLLGPTYAIVQSMAQFNRIRQLYNLGPNGRIASLEMLMEQD